MFLDREDVSYIGSICSLFDGIRYTVNVRRVVGTNVTSGRIVAFYFVVFFRGDIGEIARGLAIFDVLQYRLYDRFILRDLRVLFRFAWTYVFLLYSFQEGGDVAFVFLLRFLLEFARFVYFLVRRRTTILLFTSRIDVRIFTRVVLERRDVCFCVDSFRAEDNVYVSKDNEDDDVVDFADTL